LLALSLSVCVCIHRADDTVLCTVTDDIPMHIMVRLPNRNLRESVCVFIATAVFSYILLSYQLSLISLSFYMLRCFFVLRCIRLWIINSNTHTHTHKQSNLLRGKQTVPQGLIHRRFHSRSSMILTLCLCVHVCECAFLRACKSMFSMN
jgi:Ca2+-dependent lipid-binding protein